MNRKIFISALSILSSIAIIGGATWAYFSDAGTSNNNVFGAGTLDLKLSDDTTETDQDNVTASFGGSNLGPGNCASPAQLRVKNTGTVLGDHIEIAITNTVTDVGDVPPNPFDTYLRLNTFTYDGTPISVSDANVNGISDLDDLEANPVDNLSLTNLNSNHTIVLEVCLDGSAPNGVQGDSVDSDWTVTLNQHTSQ